MGARPGRLYQKGLRRVLSLTVDLLSWYDLNRRTFPWRALNGECPDPYHVWLSEVMLQQTTTTSVIPYFNFFIEKWPTVQDLGNAELDEILHAWQGLGYYSRARNLHKAAKMLAVHFPKSTEELLELPGVGDYTAGAIASIAYDLTSTPVDGNIARIFARLYQIDDVKPQLFIKVKEALQKHTPDRRNGDFIQGLMDVGATICLPTAPKCDLCPLASHCLSFIAGTTLRYPLKPLKKERPRRYGIVFWIENDAGQVFIRKRTEKGLLGGMMEFPSTAWTSEVWTPDQVLPFEGTLMAETVEHTFTHFHLVLNIMKSSSSAPAEGVWVLSDDLSLYALPTLMKKVAKKVFSSRL